MNEERFQNLMKKIEMMGDDELFMHLERAGMIIEDIPEGEDPDQVVIETLEEESTLEYRYVATSTNNLSIWKVMGDSPQDSSSIHGKQDGRRREEVLIEWDSSARFNHTLLLNVDQEIKFLPLEQEIVISSSNQNEAA